jgi:simple sugar transport system substrate-binding protein/ribose transport system substrate-binding protein
LIETYQAAGVRGLAIAVFDSEVAIPALRAADAAGMKIAATNIDLNAPFMVGGFTSDSKALAAQCGEAAAVFISENLGGSAQIGIIHFLEQLPEQGQQRVDGFKSALEGLDVEYVADFSAPAADLSFQRTSDMITANPDINVILACNDGGTKGAVAAVLAAGRAGEIFVFGFDVDDEVIDMLKSDDNILQAAIGQNPYAMGYDAMMLLISAINGADYSDTMGKTVIVPGKLADRADPSSLE